MIYASIHEVYLHSPNTTETINHQPYTLCKMIKRKIRNSNEKLCDWDPLTMKNFIPPVNYNEKNLYWQQIDFRLFSKCQERK